MEIQTFVIKSLPVQNTIMLLSLGIVLFFLTRSLIKGKFKHILVFLAWTGIVIWFFNSPFFGFSEVAVSRGGIKINYGILSLRNKTLPLDTPWKIETSPSGLLKISELYYLQIGDHRSMKVKGKRDLALLRRIGDAIAHMRKE
jgi:hypothetical protein